MVLLAQVIVSFLHALLGIGLAAAVAALAFGMRPPIDLAAALGVLALITAAMYAVGMIVAALAPTDRKSTRLNSSHVAISYAVFCLKKKRRSNRNENLMPITI